MASTDTDRFQSRFRKDRIDARRERTERRNKAFDASDSTDAKELVTRSAISVNVRSSARSAGSPARSEASKIDTGKTELESVTSRINRLRVNDDKDGSEDSTPARHEDTNEDDHDKKQHVERKERGAGATTSKKRQQRKNLREKRRSTGVVIMPNMEGDSVGTDDSQKVMENTHANEAVGKDDAQGKGKQRGLNDELDSIDKSVLFEQLEAYQRAIQEWKEEFEKSQKEIELLRSENQRLKDENSSLLKVVSQLSTSSRK